MGSHWLTLHLASEQGVVSALRDPASRAGLAPSQRLAVEQWLAGACVPDAKTGCHAQAPELLRAVFAVTERLSQHQASVECYVDEDESPELFDLVWGDSELPFELALPLSPSGEPALFGRSAEACAAELTTFRALATRGSSSTKYLPAADLSTLCDVLELATAREWWLFGYFEI